MTSRVSTLIAFLFFVSNIITAQNVSVAFSDKIKSTSGMTNGGVYLKSLQGDKEDIISVFGMRSKKISFVGFGADINMFPNVKLIKFNQSLDPVGELDFTFPVNAGKSGYLDIVKLNSNYYILSYSIDRSADNMEINYQQLNPSNLTLVGGTKRLTTLELSEYEGSNRIEASDLSVGYSPDSSKLLFTYEPDLKKKENKEVVIVAADDKMTIISNTKHSFNELEKKVRLTDASIDNEGKIYLSYNVYEKDYSKDFIKSDGEKIPGFVTSLCIINGKKETVYGFASEGKFIHQSSIAYDETGKVCIIGLYKEKHNGRITGAFKAVVNEAKKVIGSPAVFEAIPQNILAKVDVDNMGKSDGKKPGIDNDFRIRYSVSIFPSGTISFVSEFHEVTGYTSVAETWGDLLVTTFKAGAGKASFSLVSKKQYSVFSNASEYGMRRMFNYKYIASSFEPVFFKDRFLLFYNDDEDNLTRDPAKKPEQMFNPKKSMLIMAEILPDGQVKKKEILSHRDYDGYMTNMNFYHLKEDTYSLFALNYGFFKYGLKIGTLTIK